nr:sterile alpha motif domain-containing protein 11 [Salvelinus alpinus]
MTPEEHYRRIMSALNEQGSYEEQQQRLYQLANNMGLPSHDLLRVRQEALAAVRNTGGMEAHLPSAGSSSSQRRKQGLPQHRDAHYTEREMSHPPPLLSPQNAPHIALGPHLRPPFIGMPSALCQAPSYGFLQPAQAEMFARQQEMLRKQNLARLEMSAELLRHKELESLHRQQQQRVLGSSDPLGLTHGLPLDHPALRSLHPLHEELSRRQNAMLVLRHTNSPLLALKQQGPSGAPTPKDTQGQSCGARAGLRKGASRKGPQQPRGGDHQERECRGREGDADGHDDEMKDSDSETEMGEDRHKGSDGKAPEGHGLHRDRGKESGRKGGCDGAKEAGEGEGRLSGPCSSADAESPPSHHPFTPGLSKSDVKYHFPPGAIAPLQGLHSQSLPFGFPYTSPYFHTGGMGGMFMDGEDSAAPPVEDIRKWSVEEVCGFVGGLAGCAEYNQVARHVGRIFYMTSFPLALPLALPPALPPSALRPPDRDLLPSDTPLALPLRPLSTASSSSSPYSGPPPPCHSSPKQENANGSVSGGYEAAKTPS